MKKYNITGQKDTQKKKEKEKEKKGKWQMFIVKEKSPGVSKSTKNIGELV